MESHFLAAIDAAVDQALPAGWPRVPRPRLPARGSVRVRHAFRFAGDGGPARYLAVVAVPPLAARSADTVSVQRDLAALIDHVLASGASLLLLYRHEDDPDGWVRDRLDFPHPRFLCLACAPAERAEEYTAAPIYDWRLPLCAALRDFWAGGFVYRGPTEGVQTVGLEVMKDHCWRCRAALDTVTGIVFPDRAVADWSQPDWAYFQQLLELARIPDSLVPALQGAVDLWRTGGDRRLTVIRWRYSKTVDYAYWAAECTGCGAFQGDWPVMEERLRWLGDLESRRAGILSYRPLQLDVPRRALQELTWGGEINPHACLLGWFRAGDPELARSAEAAAGADAGPAEAGSVQTGQARASQLQSGHSAASEPQAAAQEKAGSAPGAAAATVSAALVPAPASPGRPATPESAALVPAPADPWPAAPAAPSAAATAPFPGPLHRLGEILAGWLGRRGSPGGPRRHSDPPRPPTPPMSEPRAPAAATARPASGS